MNLNELLYWLKKEGAPAHLVERIERAIERRALRIARHEQEIRRWLDERRQADDERARTPDMLLILLMILLLEADREDDGFGLGDLFRSARVSQSGGGFTALAERTPPPTEPDEEGEELGGERASLARPKW